MKVLIAVNKQKDKLGTFIDRLKKSLNYREIGYSSFEFSIKNVKNFDEVLKGETYDGLFVLGGDGTILGVSPFAAAYRQRPPLCDLGCDPPFPGTRRVRCAACTEFY